MRGPPLDLYGAAADTGTAGVGAVHVGERLSRNRALRRSLQLVPVPRQLLRPRALRVDARELEPAAERQGRPLCRQAPQAQVRGIRLRYKRVREDSDERNPYWTVGRLALWPNGFYLGNHFEWRVPVDDENTL